MKKLWDDKAWEDYKEWLVTDKKIVKKINVLNYNKIIIFSVIFRNFSWFFHDKLSVIKQSG